MWLFSKKHPKTNAAILFFLASLFLYGSCSDINLNKIYKQNLKSKNAINFIFDQNIDLQYTREQLLKIDKLLKYQDKAENIECCHTNREHRRTSRTCTIRCEQSKICTEKTDLGETYKKFCDDEEYIKCKEILLKTFPKECFINANYKYFKLEQINLSKNQIDILKKYYYKNLGILILIYLIICTIIYKVYLMQKNK